MATKREKKCIFCEKPGKLTAEHVWGDWTKQYVPRTTNKHTQGRVFVQTPDEVLRQPPKIRAGDVLNSAPEIVCVECNTTWMSMIQNRAKPFLIPLFEGRHCRLDADAQAAISSWIAMATMTGEFSNNEDWPVGIPQADRDWLMRTQTAPKGWAIWIGQHERVAPDYTWIHMAFPVLETEDLPPILKDDDRLPNSQTTKFTIGKLFLFAFSSAVGIAEGWNWQNIPRARNRLVRIFPQTHHSVFWPPPPMNDAQAIDYGHAFIEYSRNRAKRLGYR